MNRPLSDAQTFYMPELHQTRPMAVVRAEQHCAWCTIQLTAIPDRPVQFDGKLYHPGCAPRAR